MERNNRDLKQCDICNFEISKTNWSKHIKSKKHWEKIRENEQSEIEENEMKHCLICNIDIHNNFNEHLKSTSHKNNTKLIKDKMKQKVRSFNVIRQRRRNFQDIDFVTNDFIIKKSEEASEGCFLTLRITPKNDINSVYVLIEELPELMFERMKYILEEKTYELQIVIKGNFRKFHPVWRNNSTF